ncbi:polysaccharide pyruvyl transferase family protein [Microbacterium sp. 179-I 3D4 NHS]|uniref:polysaccharide pyruvyl transferase family protein n=1 Tax=Microbacterium sp. 179-I 3D4 NHS TaxID=3142381 RepID=UPI0039A337B0
MTMRADDALLLDAIDKKLLGRSFEAILKRDRNAPTVFLLCTHEWGNLGDLAINYNAVALLESAFPDRPVFAISRSALAANWQRLTDAVDAHDLIAVNGGGNLGDLWPHEEAARLAVVARFPHNRIVSLPQSIHFRDTANLRASMAAYDRHPRLLLTVRDDPSLDIARSHLAEESVVRAEELATRQLYPFPFRPRLSRTLFAERADLERRPGSRIAELRAAAADAGIRTVVTDTVVPDVRFSNLELGAKLVYDKIDEFHASDLVVTDRLHGALFALIAGRPVVVFENSYGKIGAALRSLVPAFAERIVFADDMAIQDLLSRMHGLASLEDSAVRPADVLSDAHRRFELRLREFAAVD